MEPEGSLPCSQDPSIGPYPKQIEPSPRLSWDETDIKLALCNSE